MSTHDPASTTEAEKKVRDFIRALSAREPLIRRVILFGSRARGDHHEKSDYDLAIEAPGMSDADWARFALEARDQIPTLCGLDLIRLDKETSGDLSAKIKREGVTLYARK